MIKKNTKYLIVCLFITILSANTIAAVQDSVKVIPQLIVFDGILFNNDGFPFQNGKYSLTFSIYKSENSNEAIWSETYNDVNVNKGHVSIIIGDAKSGKLLNIPFDKQYFVGISVNDEPEFKKRFKFLSVPYSARTKIASNLPKGSITADKIKENTITDEKIKSVSWSKITGKPDIKSLQSQNGLDKSSLVLPDFWRRHGNYLDIPDPFLGTVNDRNLVVRVDSVQRMLLDPYANVTIGTLQDSVNFEVIGLTTLNFAYFRGTVGVGVNPVESRLHIVSQTLTPFKVDYNNSERFKIEKNGRVIINSTLSGADDDINNYPFYIKGEDHGIAINIKGSGPIISGAASVDNNYISFWDNSPMEEMVGRIEGQTALDYTTNPKKIAHAVAVAAKVTAEAVAIAATVASAVASGGTKYNEAEDIIKLGAEIVYEAALLAIDMVNIGVTYESGSGDYAEWLEKTNIDEKFEAGDIVGVFGGKISKLTKNADQIMSVSISPIILGNMPKGDDKSNYEKVAFKGQVPIKVWGKVSRGDYIIPSGFEDGTGIAVSPSLVTLDELSNTLGVAWGESKNNGLKYITVAVGLNLNQIKMKLDEFSATDIDLQNSLNKSERDLMKIDHKITQLESKYDMTLDKLNLLKKAIRNLKNENSLMNVSQQN